MCIVHSDWQAWRHQTFTRARVDVYECTRLEKRQQNEKKYNSSIFMNETKRCIFFCADVAATLRGSPFDIFGPCNTSVHVAQNKHIQYRILRIFDVGSILRTYMLSSLQCLKNTMKIKQIWLNSFKKFGISFEWSERQEPHNADKTNIFRMWSA